MKTLTLCLSLVLTGCATTQLADLHAMCNGEVASYAQASEYLKVECER